MSPSKLISALLLMCSLTATSKISDGSRWHDGQNMFNCKISNGNALMLMEGDTSKKFVLAGDTAGLIFTLKPANNNTDEIIPILGAPDDKAELAELEYAEKKYEVISIRDSEGHLVSTLCRTEKTLKEEKSDNIVEMLSGLYEDEKSQRAYISHTGYVQLPTDTAPRHFWLEEENGNLTNVLNIEDGTRIKCIRTDNGIEFWTTHVNANNQTWECDSLLYSMDQTGSGQCTCTPGMFPIASKRPMTLCQAGLYRQKHLKLMSAEMAARHGHYFTDEQIYEYMMQQDWYRQQSHAAPTPLTPLEKLNTELLRTLIIEKWGEFPIAK